MLFYLQWQEYKSFANMIGFKKRGTKWNDHMRQFRSGPAHFPRRLVAVDHKVYVTLGIDTPLSELNADTGETIKEYKDSDWTEEIVAHEGVLYLLIGSSETSRFGTGLQDRDEPTHKHERFLAAYSSVDGKALWKALCGEGYNAPTDVFVVDDVVWMGS